MMMNTTVAQLREMRLDGLATGLQDQLSQEGMNTMSFGGVPGIADPSCHEITEAEGRIAQLREHRERMAPGICVKAFQASQQASTICSYPS